MFVHKKILEKVQKLFAEKADYRDERWETIILVSAQIKKEFNIKSEISMMKVAFDVDRAFRYIQQHNPSLRGKTWSERQKRGGEPVESDDMPWNTIQMTLF